MDTIETITFICHCPKCSKQPAQSYNKAKLKELLERDEPIDIIGFK